MSCACKSSMILLALTLAGCCKSGWVDRSTLDLGVIVDLNAVIEVPFDDAGIPTHVAVGAFGTVVTWRMFFEEGDPQSVDVSHVGSADLHAVAVVGSKWWVVGDDGMAAVTADAGREWLQADLATTTNLWGITDTPHGLVVIGDDTVLTQGFDGTWLDVPAPTGSWGELRSVIWDGERVYAVGLGGVAWSASDPSGPWQAEPIGVDVDLLSVCRASEFDPDLDVIAVAGAQGTYSIHRPDQGWTALDSGTSADLIACADGAVLTSDGDVVSVASDGRDRVSIGRFDGARSLAFNDFSDAVVVGEAGSAVLEAWVDCLF